MWSIIKFVAGVFVFFLLISLISQYVGEYNSCHKRDGNYNLTNHGFKCVHVGGKR